MDKMSLMELKTQAEIEIKRLQYQQTSKESASRYIGKYGLFYIVLIIAIGVGASIFLSESAITAVMTMIGGSLVAIISMLQGITGTKDKEGERPEIKIIQDLVSRLDNQEPMKVQVEKDKVIVKRGNDEVVTDKLP